MAQWKKISEIGIIKGNISSKKGNNGFGYDPIFIPNGYSKTFAEMDYKKKLINRSQMYCLQEIITKKLKTTFNKFIFF